ncbi:MAG TPA: divalent-cation tolerance protein CutA [Candidatus Omnitrophota bacterium]|nr:divalent-cation tolerance protein CutA [Candidatus Omnitrophota bacterium]HPS20913.1 divalent-cation tolerance protein CutA [Candidatus Omnitrophota bacterium]
MDKLCTIYVTVPSKKDGVKIGRMLIRKKLAACVNIFDGMTSIYKWKDKICEDKESVMFIKTRHALFNKVRDAVRSVHPYECPCIVELPLVNADDPYKQWVIGSTKKT